MNKQQGMLLDDFFELIETRKTENALVFRVRCVEGHDIYKGHFPETPVTPGVSQMMLVKACLETYQNKALLLKECRECKFLAMHTPKKELDLELSIEIKETEKEGFRIQAILKGKENVYLKMKALFVEDSSRGAHDE